MIWFGSSAGVALSNLFPESRSVLSWIRHGWHVAVAYPLGFFALLALLGWEPTPERTVPGGAPDQHSHLSPEGSLCTPAQSFLRCPLAKR